MSGRARRQIKRLIADLQVEKVGSPQLPALAAHPVAGELDEQMLLAPIMLSPNSGQPHQREASAYKRSIFLLSGGMTTQP